MPEILSRYDTVAQSDIIPILQDVQGAYGYLPRPALEDLSRRTRIPLVRIHGVATFYAQFSFEPRGRYIVRICRGTACHVKGSQKILETVQSHLKIGPGETAPDMKFTLETVACLGTCFLAPVMMINNEYYGDLTPEKAVHILDAVK